MSASSRAGRTHPPACLLARPSSVPGSDNRPFHALRVARAAISLAVSLAIGCGGDRSKISVEPAEEYPTRSVQLDGVPSEIDEPTVRFRALEDEWSGWSVEVRAERDETGRLTVWVPAHPAGLDAGGPLELSVVGLEDATSTLLVRGVPAAPGTTREFVASTARIAREMIESWDIAADDVLRTYRENPSELPPQLFYAALAVDLIAGPDNPNALLSVIDGTAPVLAGRTLDLDAADRLLALWEIQTAVSTSGQEIDEPVRVAGGLLGSESSFFLVQDWPRSFSATPSPGSDSPTLSLRRATLPKAQGSTLPLPRSGKVSIHTPAALDHWMRKRAELERQYGGLKRKVRNDIASLLGLVPHGASAVLGITNNAFDYALRSNLALLPSHLDQLNVNAEPTDFLEDDTSVGGWTASVVARSGVLQFTYADLVDVIATAWTGATFGIGTARAGREVVSGVEALESSLASKVSDYAASRLADKSKDWKKDKTEVKGPYEWGPIEVSDKQWTMARISSRSGTKPCARMTNLQRSYLANSAGDCRLVVEIRTEGGKFGGVSSWGDVPLTVKTINVGVTPNRTTVKPGSKTTFTATVRNAARQDVRWDATGGSGVPGRENKFEWTAPKLDKDRCRELFTIEAESMTRRGPRESGDPPRVGRATITVEEPTELEIIPGDAVLLPGETLHFRYKGPEEAEVDWSADTPGEIDAKTGLFKAPKQNGLYEVTARVSGKREEDSCAEDAVIVRVSSCSWIVMFDGKTIVSKPGDVASFTDMLSGFTIGLAQNEGGMVTLIGSGAESGAVGSNMGASMYEQYTGEFPIFFDRKDGGVVTGRASGTVQVLDAMTYSERSAQLSVEFVIADDDLMDPLITSVTHLSCEVR